MCIDWGGTLRTNAGYSRSMTDSARQQPNLSSFLTRWKTSGGSELANAQLFLAELCDVLDVPRPEPAGPVHEDNVYSYERKVFVPRGDGTSEMRRLDLYRKGCFVLEAKQGQDQHPMRVAGVAGHTSSAAVTRGTRTWEDAMQRAKRQAENYIRCLPAAEGRPPILIVADVGFCFDLYTEFSCTGGVYLHYPDARRHRIMLDDLANPDVRDLFRAIWMDPLSLDPSLRAAKVTEEVAGHLAKLARMMEDGGHDPNAVAQFLMRCIFSMFAEDVGLLPFGSFTRILEKSLSDPEMYPSLVRDVWTAMNDGGIALTLQEKLLRFNGSLFADPEVLPLRREHLAVLLEAAGSDWKEVEPAIFGTLLERALSPKERHKLGAHYTPRAYVERLVIPTVMEPLRDDWDNVQTTANLLFHQGKVEAACKSIDKFHDRLRKVRVLDPACGSGNFLYVAMEHMKRLEGEVLQALAAYGETQPGLMQIDPQQFLGLEINPRAAHIAEMVLWIGYLQWHFRTHGQVKPPEPVISKFNNIQHKDALIDYASWDFAVDEHGKPVSRWDGETYRTDPATGRRVPDGNAVVVDELYEGVSASVWPRADFIVGNPPFIGGKDKRQTLGRGYFDALTRTYGNLPDSCDYVMYWWHKAAELVGTGSARRFGFITTNSLSQVFNRRVVSMHLQDENPVHLVFAVPDHPWVDAADGAAVRIAMTVVAKGAGEGVLATLLSECETDGREVDVSLQERYGVIHADLRQGPDLVSASALVANDGLCSCGMALHGSGFKVSTEQACLLGLGRICGLERHIRPYRNGRDIADRARGVMVIDLFGLTAEDVLDSYPEVYQWVYTRVKPERDYNNEKSRRVNWWLFGRKNTELRDALAGLHRYISTIETAKHRFFVFLSAETIPDHKLVNIASSDAFHLGVLSSRLHVCWALALGGTLEDRPVYNKTRCFDTFPFPVCTPKQQGRIGKLAERMDAHRKTRQAIHPGLTLTGMYNVIEALRVGRVLTDKELMIHENGLVSTLLALHKELDAAVAEAYGWPVDLPDEEILARLVELNAERAKEEQQGKTQWLRPEYQTKSREERRQQSDLEIEPEREPKAESSKPGRIKGVSRRVWPSDLREQTQSVRDVIAALRTSNLSVSVESIAGQFLRAPRGRVEEILGALRTLGMVDLF